MLDIIAIEVVGALIANGVLVGIGYVFFDRKRKQSLKKIYERTASSATRSINMVLDIILDEILLFLYISKAVTGREIEELVIAKNTVRKEDKRSYLEFRNRLLKYLNTNDIFELMVSAKRTPATFWIPVFQAVRNLNVETNKFTDIFQTTGSFEEIDYLTGLSERSESILNRLSMLQQTRDTLAQIGSEKLREEVFKEMRELISECLKAGTVFKEGELTYKPTIKPG